MKKTKYLVAALLLMGATTTFTSCIDNDEPAGIEELRGAKAELILAKAKVELANEAWVRAKVAEQELINQGKEISNKMAEIQLKAAEIDLKIREAKSEAELAYWKVEKQKWDQELRLQKVQYETLIAKAQTELEQALYNLEATKEYIAKLKLVASEAEAQQLKVLQARVGAAAQKLIMANGAYTTYYKDYIHALESTDIPSLKVLEATLARKEGKVAAWEIVVAEDNRLIEKAEDFANVNWNEEVLALANKVKAAKISLDSAKHEELVFKLGDTYQAAEKSYKEAVEALGEFKYQAGEAKKVEEEPATKAGEPDAKPGEPDAKPEAEPKPGYQDPEMADMEYVNGKETDDRVAYSNDNAEENKFNGKKTLAKAYYDAVQDSVNAAGLLYKDVKILGETPVEVVEDDAAKLKLAEYASEPINEGLIDLFKESLPKTGLDGYNWNTGVFHYTAVEDYRQAVLDNDSVELAKDKNFAVQSAPAQRIQKVQKWIEAVSKYAVNPNDLEWIKKEKERLASKYETEGKDNYIKKFSEVDSVNWARVRDVFVGDSVNNVPMSKAFTTALNTYNTKFDNLANKIKEYTEDYDSLYTKGYDASVKLTKETKAVDFLEQVFFNQNGNGGFFYANKAYAYYIVEEGGSKVTKCFINDWNDLKKKKGVTPAELIEKLQKMVGHALEISATTNVTGTANEHFTKAEADKEYAEVKVLLNKWFDKDNIEDGAVDGSKINQHYFDMVSAAHDAGRTATWPATQKSHEALKTAIADFEAVQDLKPALAAHLTFAKTDYIQKLVLGKKKNGSDMTMEETKAALLNAISGTGAAYVHTEQVAGAVLSKDKKTIVTQKDAYVMGTRTKVDVDKVAEKMTFERIDLDAASTRLNELAKEAFGVFAYTAEGNRILLPTQAEIDAYFAEKKFDTRADKVKSYNDPAQFGSYGHQFAYQLELELVDLKLASSDKVAPVKEMLEAQLAKLQAEIAENEAKFVTPKVEAAKAAKAAFEAGREAVTAAEAARAELAAPVEAVVDKANTAYEAIKAVYQDLKNTLDAYLGEAGKDGEDTNYPTDVMPQTAEAIIQHFKQQLLQHKEALAKAQKEVDEQKVKIENFKNGMYDAQADIVNAQANLKEAAELLEVTQKAYDVALADLNKFLAEMAK